MYKNKKEIFRFDGYYSKVVDIVDEEVYFIANTQTGSTLYKLKNNSIYKLNNNDNIIDAKIIDNDKALVVSITSNSYNTHLIDLEKDIKSDIFITKNIKQKNSFKFKEDIKKGSLKTTNYNELKELKFSMLYPSYSYSSEDGSGYLFDALFIDPIMFNMLNIYAYKNKDDKVAGIKYINERYIPYAIDVYDIKREDKYIYDRGYGGSIEVYGPLYKKGRDILNISLKQSFDDKNKDKNPTIISLNHINQKSFQLEDLPYFKSDTKVILKQDRGDIIGGIDYKLNKHISTELYFNIQLQGVYSNIDTFKNQRGIEIVTDKLDANDEMNILIEGCDNDFFVKDITKISAGLSKTFYLSSYYSVFPISLRKESLFYRYNQFEITEYKDTTIKENIVGLKLDLLFFHKLSLPLTIKYIENDLSIDDYKVIVSVGTEF